MGKRLLSGIRVLPHIHAMQPIPRHDQRKKEQCEDSTYDV
jgi:hypothetical protein